MENYDIPTVKRGRPSKFNSEDAVSVALRIGVSQFTMREVASELKVSTPALYRCFSSREALLDACLEEISSTMEDTPYGHGWESYLGNVADRSWKLFTRYPGLQYAVQSRPKKTRPDFPMRDSDYTRLSTHGFSRNQARFALAYILNLTTSAVSMLQVQLSELTRCTGERQGVFRTSDGRQIHDRDDLSEVSRRQWQCNIDFFIDHLTRIAPRWPSWVGPVTSHRTDTATSTDTDQDPAGAPLHSAQPTVRTGRSLSTCRVG